MSAAATAAGYLYASGRLRGRGAREQEHAQEEQNPPRARPPAARGPAERPVIRKPVRVAALPEGEEAPRLAESPKRAPRIEYRVRRWHPRHEANGHEE